MHRLAERTILEHLTRGGVLAGDVDEMLAADLGSTFFPVQKSKFYGAFVLNRRVDLHAIDATPARWRGDAGSSPLDRARSAASSPRNDLVKNCRVHPTHWLISTQHATPGFKAPMTATCAASSMAWRCRFLTARRSQHGRVIAEK